jgi:hypothetical protein
MKKWLDKYNTGGLLSRTVTCSNCGWSWKAVDGGKDPMTCHKCGGMAKLQNGGWLNKYDVGGPGPKNKTNPPIFTDNKNDPRLKAYNDSLTLYNSPKQSLEKLNQYMKEAVESTSKYYNDPTINTNTVYNEKIKNIPLSEMGELYQKYAYQDSENILGSKSKINPESYDLYHMRFKGNIFNNFRGSSIPTKNVPIYKKPIQPYIYKKPDLILKPRNRATEELIKATRPSVPQLAQGPNIQVQPRSIQNLPYQVDWRMNNENRTNYFPSEKEGAEFLKELDPITGLPEYRNRGDYNASGHYTVADKLRGFKQGGSYKGWLDKYK